MVLPRVMLLYSISPPSIRLVCSAARSVSASPPPLQPVARGVGPAAQVEAAHPPVDETGRDALERHGRPVEPGDVHLRPLITRCFDDSLGHAQGRYAADGRRRGVDY